MRRHFASVDFAGLDQCFARVWLCHCIYLNKLLAQESAQPLKLSKNTSTVDILDFLESSIF